MRNSRRCIGCGAAGFMMLWFVGANANAQAVKKETARPISSIQGVDTYQAYCAVCHGPQAKGNGPAAVVLKKAPADLTTIAKRNGGKFSTTDVEAVITGQQVMASHGSRDMPIWGPVFKSFSTDPTFAKMRMSNLLDYLKSIQTQ